eukprot:TRINITY_DN56239_c0_g1_i3.p3 TRINITY_DN56239_c0_g1~~TRINITY_DN56239_c0_g1_i3.p3  ORF type:complete len:138 (-),score=21.53 TRINITY_DN56239_c0_g1_i3:456-869(-)
MGKDKKASKDAGKSAALVLKGSEELAFDYEVFGRYEQSGVENGKPKYLGPKTEGCWPSIAFCIGGDGEPTWWVYDASGGECFYAESDSDVPPRTGWRKQYADEDLEVTLEVEGAGSFSSATRATSRSRSPRKGKCPW